MPAQARVARRARCATASGPGGPRRGPRPARRAPPRRPARGPGRGSGSDRRPWPIIRASRRLVTATFALDMPKYDDDLRKAPGATRGLDPNRIGSTAKPTGPAPADRRRGRPHRPRQPVEPSRLLGIAPSTPEGPHRSMARRSDIGAAVIGSGFIGTVHVEALRRIGVSVRGAPRVSTPERGAARAAQLGVGHAYGSLDELLADDRVQVVHVTSPNELHYPQVKAILAAGRHVVCEKPLAMTAGGVGGARRARRGAAASSTRSTSTSASTRSTSTSRSSSATAALGDVRLVTGRYFQDWLLYDTDWNWRLEPDRGGALRAVGDIGSHWLDLTTFLTGRRVVSVMADLTTFIPVRHRADRPGRDLLDRARRRDRRASRSTPRTSRRSCSASRAGRAAQCRRLAAQRRAARTACSTRSTAPPPPSRGIRSSPSSCGSAIATGPTSSCSATRR